MNKPLALDAQQNVTAPRLAMGALELHLKNLVSEHPEKAQLAAIDDHTRIWFVAEVIAKASGRIPLLEIEGLVSRHLATLEGVKA